MRRLMTVQLVESKVKSEQSEPSISQGHRGMGRMMEWGEVKKDYQPDQSETIGNLISGHSFSKIYSGTKC